jgi:nitroreductase
MTDAGNPVLDAILSRASVRSYRKDPVADEQIEVLLRAGMAAPSACDTRPWSFVVCRETKWFDAPCAIVVCGKRTAVPAFELDGVWAQDCAAATENILLAAHSMGLGACWRVCWPSPTAMATVKAQVGLPFGVVPFSYVTVGVPAESPAPKDKYDPKLIHYEKW